MNERLGTIDADGVMHWPRYTVTGRAYTRPAHTRSFGTQFIVYDLFGNSPEEIESVLHDRPDEPDQKPHRMGRRGNVSHVALPPDGG